MATLRNTNPVSPVFLPLVGQDLEFGDVFEVSDEQATALLEQAGNYEAVDATPAPKTKADTKPAATDAPQEG